MVNPHVFLVRCLGRLVFAGMALMVCIPLYARGQVVSPEIQGRLLNRQQQTDPGTLLDYARKTLDAEEKQQRPPLPEATAEIEVVSPHGEPQTQPDAIRFNLSEVHLTGVSVFQQSDISAIITPYLGKEAGIAELTEIKNRIFQLYQSHGYITTRVFLPPQDVSRGEVTLQVVEGRIGQIEIQGLKHLDSSYIYKRLSVSSGDIFRVQDLEQSLRRLNQSPVVELKADIRPGETFGTSDIILYAKERKPLTIAVFGDNQGRENIGFYRQGFSVEHHNFTGLGDRLGINGLLSLSEWGTEGTQGFFGTYTVPIGTKGVEAGVSASSGFTQVGGPLRQLDIHGRSYTMGLFATGPLWQGERHRLLWDMGLDAKRSLQFLGDIRFPDLGIPNTEVRTVHAGITWTGLDRFGRTTLQQQITQGIGALGGTTAFLRYNVDLARIHALMRGSYLIGRLSGQLTPDNLVSMEQFQLGGAQSVRGYSEGLLIGDEGYFASIELRLPLSFFSDQWTRNVQVLSFFEAGAAGSNADNQISGSTGNIRSIGVGLRAKLSGRLYGRLDAGFNLSGQQDEPTARIHFGLSSSLL